MDTGFHIPATFGPHPNLSDRINGDIVQSEIEGGIYLADLAPGIRLEFRTEHHRYLLTNIGQGRVSILVTLPTT